MQDEGGVGPGLEEGEGGGGDVSLSDMMLRRKIKAMQVLIGTLTTEKDKLTRDLEEKVKALSHYKGKKEAASGGAKAEVEKVKMEFENYKRKSEDQLSKARSFLGTLKRSLADAELNLDKLRKERAAVMAANRDAHATAEEAMARQAEIDNLRANAAVAEPLRKFAREICGALGIKYVDPKVVDEDGHAEENVESGFGGGGFLPNISGAGPGSAARAGNPSKRAGGGGGGVAEAEGIGAAMAKILTVGVMHAVSESIRVESAAWCWWTTHLLFQNVTHSVSKRDASDFTALHFWFLKPFTFARATPVTCSIIGRWRMVR